MILTCGIDDAALFLDDYQILSDSLVRSVLSGAYDSELRLVVDQSVVRLQSRLNSLHSPFGLFINY